MSLPSLVDWLSLPVEILKYHLRSFLNASKSIQTARLVCTKWHKSFPLPLILINDAPYNHSYERMYTDRVYISRDVDPLLVLKATKAVKVTLTSDRPSFPAPQLLKDIALCDNIVRLDLSGALIDEALIDLLTLTKSIQTLCLASAKFKSAWHEAEFYDQLKLNRTIKTLDISGRGSLDTYRHNCVSGLLGCASLTNLNVSNTSQSKLDAAKHLAEIISGSQSLRVLNMSLNTLNDRESLSTLIQSIAVNRSVTSLDMSRCFVGVKRGEVEIFEALRHNTAITKINLVGMCPDEATLKVLMNSIAENPTLTSITFSPCAASTAARTGDLMTHWFTDNTSNITSLTLAQAKLSKGEISSLFNFLKTTKSLTMLNLAHIRLDASLSDLSEGLALNKSLRHLDLTETMLGERARSDQIVAFSNAVSRHPTLTYLNLRQCKMAHASFTELCKHLAMSKRLQTLNLSSNRLGASQAPALEPLFTQNFSLTHIDLSGNQFGTPGAEILAPFLATNSTLLRLSTRSNHFNSIDLFMFIDAAIRSQLLELDLRGNGDLGLPNIKKVRETIANQRPAIEILFRKQVSIRDARDAPLEW